MSHVFKLMGQKLVRASQSKVTAFIVGTGLALTAFDTYAVDSAGIVSYDSATKAVSWDFSSVLTNLMTGIVAAIGCGVVIFIITYGWRLAKRFFK